MPTTELGKANCHLQEPRLAKVATQQSGLLCDNTADITSAIKNLKLTHVSAHNQPNARDALKVMKPNVDKKKVIVDFFHQSTIATKKLKSSQHQMAMLELRPKHERITRWNPTVHMPKWVLESKYAIIHVLAIINAPVDAHSSQNDSNSAY